MIGLIRPFQRDGKSGFAKGAGDDLIIDRIEAICGAAGELPWKPELSSGLDRLRNTKNSVMLAQMATVYVQTAVTTFEPGVTGVGVSASQSDSTLDLSVTSQRAGQALPVATVSLS